VDLGAYHSEGFGARVDIVQSRFDRFHVSAKFLIDAVIALGNGFIRVLDEAAAQAWAPGSSEPAAFSPGVQAFAVEGQLWLVWVALGELYVLGLSGESLVLILHIECL
jgi:hypothetical protein